MKALKNLSPYKYLLLILLNILLSNIYIFIISIIYIYFDNKDNLIYFIIILILINLTNCIKTDFIRIGIVDEKRNNYYVINEGLYYSKIYSNDLNIGDVVKLNGNYDLAKKDELKYNYRYIYKDDYSILFNLKIKGFVNERISSYPDEASIYLKRFIYNDNTDNSLINLGYGFSFYILLVYIKKKHPYLSILLLLLFSLIFKFDVKYYLIIIDVLFKTYNKKLRYYLKVLIIMLLNYNLLFNYSILITLLFNLFFMLNIKNDKSYLMIGESLLFYEIEPLNIYFYKYLIIIRIIIFVISIFTLIFNSLTSLYIDIINIYVKLLDLISFEIRGQLNFIFVILLIVYKLSKYNNSIISAFVVILLLLSPINNPLFSVTFIDIGQGDSILIHNKHNILIDTGSSYNYSDLKRSLYKEGVYDIEYLVITHNDEDHNGNINNLKNDFNIKEIVSINRDIKIDDLYLRNLDLGEFNDDNDNSLVYYLDYDNFKYLFTGDISSNVENYIFDKYSIKDIDVLKVSHHGSKYSTSKYFLSNMLPKIAVISTSGMYNHPSEEVINNLNDFKVDTFVTKDVGSVKIIHFFKHKILKTNDNHFVIIKS